VAEYKGILICAETADGKLSGITLELLGCARKLAAQKGEEVAAVIVGAEVEGLAGEAIAYGADKVYVVDDPALRNFLSESYVPVLEKVVREVRPEIFLLGQTSMGRDLAPRLAFRLGTGVALDCIDLDLDPDSGNLLMTRPVYGGNARAIFTTDARPQMATIRAKAFSPLERDDSRKGEVIKIAAELDPSRVKARFVEKVKAEVTGVKLEDAPVVVSGGRGIGGPEGFRTLEELARLLKGAVGATRAAVDNGWWPSTHQIGLTGKIVTPDLYVAVALSGASQHMAGCSGSKVIVAINKDPEANIFKEAQYGVVGDYRQVLPAFIRKVKELVEG